MVAPRNAAGDLQIDDAVLERGCARTTSCSTTLSADSGIGSAMRSSPSERTQALHVPALVDQAAAAHLADFIDAVGELIAAVLDMDARRRCAADSGR